MLKCISLITLFEIILLPLIKGQRERFLLKQHLDQSLQDPERICDGMVNVEFDRICTQKYPREIILKYGDNLIVPGEPFSVFHQKENTTNYFLTFKPSRLHRCQQVLLINKNRFLCVSNNKSVFFEDALMYCYGIHMQLVDDILAQCLLKIESTKFYPKSEFVSLHYARSISDQLCDYRFLQILGVIYTIIRNIFRK